MIQLHRDAMRAALRDVSGWLTAVSLEPLAGLFDLYLDAGEVDPAQGHQDFMAAQHGLERDAHWCFREWDAGDSRQGDKRDGWCGIGLGGQRGIKPGVRTLLQASGNAML